ncbi:MAG: PaaI family thioesterase [Pseudomonadales bacterium]|jgi:uncharacterized protein (TIGR00369 family)
MLAAITADEINAYLAEAFPISGQRCVEVGGRWAVAAITPDERSRRPGDIISGPTIFGLCDAVLWYALFGAVGLEPMALTSELSIRYLRPARGDTVFARGELHHVGKRSVIGSIRCWVDEAEDKTVAVAQGTYIRPQPRS